VEGNKGLIVITLIRPHLLPPPVNEASRKLQRSTPGTWPFYFEFNEGFKEPQDLKEKIRFIAQNLNKARRAFLNDDFQYFLNIDSDVIVPPFAISELLASGGDVAVGLYRMKQPPHTLSPWVEEPAGSGKIRELTEDELSQRFIEVHRFGFGCCLIKRRVLEAIEFEPDLSLGPDFAFAKRCQEKGFKVVACTRVKCGHVVSGNKVVKV